MTGLSWRFRGGNPDGGRDFGNANVWAFDPTLDVFTREVCQNTLDVRHGPGVRVDFGLYTMREADLASFLPAIGWSALEPHLRASADPEQKFGRELRQGLDHLDEQGEMVVLRITERDAKGLLGAETGVNSNFAALCRNNLDSNKGSTSGGTFGLGKAVLWRCSSLSTVLFHSDLVEPLEGDPARQHGRVFGRCELAWHELDHGEFAGPGWFGAIDADDQAVSAWNAGSQATGMLLDRSGAGPGTSILVIGFHDPSREGQESVEEMAVDLADALCKHFWPAIHAGTLTATVGYWAEGADGTRTDVPVDLAAGVGPFVALADRARDDDLDEELDEVGAVTRRLIDLTVPPRLDGEHDRVTHHPELIVRRADAKTDTDLVSRVALVRGLGMVVDYWSLPNLRIGARPFHAVLRCGEASSDGEGCTEAEQFLRIAEPPAHDAWKVTPDMGATYKPGGGARLDEMRDHVRQVLRALVAPRATGDADGPEELKRLLTIKTPAARKGEPHVTKTSGHLEGGSWSLSITVTAMQRAEHVWQFEPVVQTAVEGGGARTTVRVAAIDELRHCEVDADGLVRMNPARRQCKLRLLVDAASLPGRPEDVALDVKVASRKAVYQP